MCLRSCVQVGYVLMSTMLSVLSDPYVEGISSLSHIRITNRYQKMRELQKEVDQFYDGKNVDYETDHMNKSTIQELNDLILLKLQQAEALKERKDKLHVRINQVETSCNRIRSGLRSNNVVVLGLKYSNDWNEVYRQLTLLYDYLGNKFEDRLLQGIRQERLIRKPQCSRLMLTFKKVQSKQVLLIKFRVALEEYEKINNVVVDYKNRKLGRVPDLQGCEIYIQDDVDRQNKLLFSELKKLQRRYPSIFKSYIKDSRIYYKLIYSPRPKCMSRLEDVDALAEKLRLASLNGTLPRPPEIKLFRSGTVFPWEVYQYNRTRLIMQTLAN